MPIRPMSVLRRNVEGVILYNKAKAYEGYTLFIATGCLDVWLIDMYGRFVHRWRVPNPTGLHGYLLPNGNLLYCGRKGLEECDEKLRHLGTALAGRGGDIIEMDWDGNLVWKYEDQYQNHTICRMSNGNTLISRFIWIPDELRVRVRGGIPGTERLPNGEYAMWTDGFQEVTPDGKVVWEWSAIDHLDPEKNTICPLCPRSEWTHSNSAVELPDGNIVFCYRHISTIGIIDKPTGKIIWQWGPGEVFHQHDPTLVENGNILLFDNGSHRLDPNGEGINYSKVLEVNPRTNKIEWEYKASPPQSFYSWLMGGCQRLPNGNTLICDSEIGRTFEVTREGEIVWDYTFPFYSNYLPIFRLANHVFRAYRYGPDFPGLKGKDLDPSKFDFINRLFDPYDGDVY